MESAPPTNSGPCPPAREGVRQRLLSPAEPASSGFFRAGAPSSLLAALILLYVIVFTAHSLYTFLNFGFSAYDAGIHDQAIWKLATGRGLFNTVRGLNVWGDHCWFVMLFMAPLYWLAPHMGTLLGLQSAALAAGAIPLAALTHRRTGNPWAGALMGAAWLLSPALQNMNLENFHPEVVAAPFLLWAIERADARRWGGYWTAFGLALICKEDMALTLFALSAWVFLRHSRRHGAIGLALCVLWFALCMKVVLPALNERGFFRFSGGYWFSGFWERKWDPAFYRECLSSPQAAQYLLKLGVPLLFLSLLCPLLAAIALPGLFVNLVSRNPYLVSIDFHYTYQILPPLFAAAACAIGWTGARLPWGRLAVWVLAAGVAAASWQANARWSHLPPGRALGDIQRLKRHYEGSGAMPRFRRLAAHLPHDRDVPIAASHNLVPHLTHRNEIYMFPNPWKPEYWGIDGEGLEGRSARVAALIVDRFALDDTGRGILQTLLATGEFEVVEESGPILAARRRLRPPTDLTGDPLRLPPPEKGVRVLAYRHPVALTSLTPLGGVPPTIEAQSLRIALPQTFDRLRTFEGMDLGGKRNIRVVFCGRWIAEGQDEVRFRMASDDGSRLYVDGAAVLSLDGIRALGAPLQSAPLRLAPGPHTIVADYFQAGGEAGLIVEFAGPGQPFRPLDTTFPLP